MTLSTHCELRYDRALLFGRDDRTAASVVLVLG